MRSRPRKRLAIPAVMFSILAAAFSCSYGDDDDDEKDKDDKKAEAMVPGAVIASHDLIELGLKAALQQAQGKPEG